MDLARRWFCRGLAGAWSGALLGCRPEAPATSAAQAVRTPLSTLIWAPDWAPALQRIADAFMQAQPAVEVQLQLMIGESVEDNLQPRVSMQRLPDLISLNPNTYAGDLADQGVLADVSTTRAWARQRADLCADWTSPGGRAYGVSGGLATILMYYNKALFARAGVRQPPEHFDAFLQSCAALKRAGITPFMLSGGFANMLGNGLFAVGFAQLIAARDPDWRSHLRAGTLDLGGTAGTEIFARMRHLVEQNWVQRDFLQTDYDAGIRLFNTGQVAMILHGSWAAGLLHADDALRVGLFRPPWNAPGEMPVPVVGSETGFAVCRTTHQIQARQWLEFLMDQGFVVQQAERHNIPPFATLAGHDWKIAPQLAQYVEALAHYPRVGELYYNALPAESLSLLHALMLDVLIGAQSAERAAMTLDAALKSWAGNRRASAARRG